MTGICAHCGRDATEGHRLDVCADCGWEIAQRYAERILADERRRREAERPLRVQRARERRGDGEGGLVYYVQIGDSIKIGYTTRLRTRLSDLRVSATALLAFEPGPPELERERHRDFASDRIGRREDFHPSRALLAHIDRMKAAHELPSWTRHPDTSVVTRRTRRVE